MSALVYGDGEYASARESGGSVAADLAVASAGGSISVKVLHRRHVRGWVAAMIKTTDLGKAAAVGALGRGTVAGIREESVPDQAKVVYATGKIDVRPHQSSFAFVDASNRMLTEREFARRYKNVVQSDELDPVDRHWSVPAIVALGSLTAVSCGVAAWGWLGRTQCTPDAAGEESCEFKDTGAYDPAGKYKSDWHWGAAAVGTAGLLGFGIGTSYVSFANVTREGDFGDHRLSEYDARVLAGRYNRALLRKAVRDLDQAHASIAPQKPYGIAVSPAPSLGGLSLVGSF